MDKKYRVNELAKDLNIPVADITAKHYFDYTFGYELLMLNGMLTFALLYISSLKNSKCFR